MPGAPLTLARTMSGIQVIEVTPETRRALMLGMTAVSPGAHFIVRQTGKKWDGTIRLYYSGRGGEFFPPGLLQRAIDIGASRGDNVKVEDHRLIVGPCNEGRRAGYPKTGVILRQAQERLVEAALEKRRGIWHAVPNSGKTEAAFELIERLYPLKALILLPRVSFLEQTLNRTRTAFQPEEIGLVHQKTRNWQRITVASIPTLAAMLEKERKSSRQAGTAQQIAQYPVIIVDECHLASSSMARQVFRHTIGTAEYVIGLSGTPWTGDPIHDLRMEAMIGPVIARISAADQALAGVSAEPCVIRVPFSQRWIPGGYEEARQQGIYHNAERNELIRHIWQTLREHEHVIFIPTDSLEHIEELKALINGPGVGVVTGADSVNEREAMFEAMRRGEIHTFIATNVLDLGINIPELSAVIEAGAHGSPVQTIQRLGRIQRKKSRKHCLYVLPMDFGNPYLARLYRRRFHELQSEAACQKIYSVDTMPQLSQLLGTLQ